MTTQVLPIKIIPTATSEVSSCAVEYFTFLVNIYLAFLVRCSTISVVTTAYKNDVEFILIDENTYKKACHTGVNDGVDSWFIIDKNVDASIDDTYAYGNEDGKFFVCYICHI